MSQQVNNFVYQRCFSRLPVDMHKLMDDRFSRLGKFISISSEFLYDSNHFQQSYTLQVQWILEAVFARLGVRHQARNFGLGGLGTLQSGLATKAIYGPDVDVLMWDR